MQTVAESPVLSNQGYQQAIAIAATFTAEPIEASLAFWVKELDLPLSIRIAPYNQVFQELLNPTSLLSQNQGVNVILLRFEDWRRDQVTGDEAVLMKKVEQNLQDLIAAIQTTVTHSSTPHLLCLCPDSPTALAVPGWAQFCQRLEAQMVTQLTQINGLYLVTSKDFALYPVEDYYDPQRDKLGHIPFTPLFFTALSTVLARKIYTLKSAPYKVIVLDCDNTLWKGVVGEDGVMGIQIPPAWKTLQEFMVAQQQAGMLICLCSKNVEHDVLEVFQQRSEMPLKLENIVSWRINWLPKSENIRSLAQELNLGLDSFIFMDDNPVECAEMRASCPEVLTLQLPGESDIPRFLQHVWAFDHLKVTEEDRQRTTLYKQNIERDRFQQEALTIEDFLAGLELKIEISEPSPDQIQRVAQLTQRTNQFNFTTIRRSESEIQQLAQAGLECCCVEVRDRFGDYGLVGVMIFGKDATALNIDTFLLSCRVLGRGVEHAMLIHLAKIAQQEGLSLVNAPFIPTKKNQPALNFLESVAADYKQETETGFNFSLPTDVAAAVAYSPHTGGAEPAAEKPKQGAIAPSVAESQVSKSERFTRIANELFTPTQVLAQSQSQWHNARPSLDQPFVVPRTETERSLAVLWSELLHIDPVGVQDNYFDLGGTSLLAVELFVRIEKEFGKKFPLTTLLEAPTVEQLARLITGTSSLRDSLVLIRDGGLKPPVFLVHDGDGETMLYRNLAYRLDRAHKVYGLQPYAQEGCPILHTRIPEMASYYIEKIRSVQPKGPYLLGGMCAGGVIAFEMARQLQSQGEAIGMVALIDAADVEAPKRVGRIVSHRLKRFSSIFEQKQTINPVAKFLTILNKVGQKVTNLLTYEVQSRATRVWNQFRMKQFRACLDKGVPIPSYLHNLSVRTVYTYAEADYIPESLHQGDVLLLRATAGEGTDEPWIEVYSDPFFGWEKRITGTVCVYDIPGGHSSMLQEPNVEVMAEVMQDYINRALTPEFSDAPALVQQNESCVGGAGALPLPGGEAPKPPCCKI
ncbi:HAD-IIIC family phosphatase [Leptothermofonsia sp. ETS-13]|uniref:HAD-IIIC family phosphatase n=1 Tax=Leptothermofonsia sp. ETS-13 TaxID=3035696 RepID=UPI003BA1EC85